MTATKTYSAKPGDVQRRWFVVDAADQVLGRLATRVATVIRGKHKPPYTPHIDVGDFVVVINAEKVKLTGNKLDSKLFRRHSGYPGGLTEIPYRRLLATHPERAIEQAVWGMLPKGRLGRQLKHKLKVYAGTEHPHASQKPEPLDLVGPIPVYVDPEPPRKPKPRPEKKGKKAPATAKAKAKSKAAPKRKPARGSTAKSKPAARKSTAKAPKAEAEGKES